MINREDLLTVELANIIAPRVLPLYAAYRAGESTKRFVAIGDALARNLINVSQEDFDAQLDAARAENANLIGWSDGRTTMHFVGSVIAVANGVLARHALIPAYYLNDVARINRVFVAYFLRQSPMDETLSIDVAGWVDATTVVSDMMAAESPASFTSSLKVTAVPVSSLFPISTLPKLDFDFVF